ncbi:MAG: hypothetical protein OHK0053_03750 [Microscillaceae bacterium]
MIQRVQTIFLFVVVLSMVLCFFFPIWEKQNTSTQEKTSLNLFSLKYEKKTEKGEKAAQTTSTFYLALLAAAAAATALYSIFRYDNRLTQMKLGLLNSLLMSIMLALSVYFITYYGEKSFPKPEFGTYLVSFYLMIAGLISNLVANRFIRRDENLVRSSNRMR